MLHIKQAAMCSILALSLTIALPASAVSPEEKPVIQKLHDMQALLNTGVNLATYSQHLDELIILNDRLKRTQRKDTLLQSVVDRMVDGRDLWQEQVNSTGSVAESMEKRVQINFKIAYMYLESYEHPGKK